MKALNIKIDESLYEKLRTYSFIQKKPMTVIIRDYITDGLEKEKDSIKEKTAQVLEMGDEIFSVAMNESFSKFDDVYKKLAQ